MLKLCGGGLFHVINSMFQTSEIIQYQPGSGSSEHIGKPVSIFRLYKVTIIIFSPLCL